MRLAHSYLHCSQGGFFHPVFQDWNRGIPPGAQHLLDRDGHYFVFDLAYAAVESEWTVVFRTILAIANVHTPTIQRSGGWPSIRAKALSRAHVGGAVSEHRSVPEKVEVSLDKMLAGCEINRFIASTREGGNQLGLSPPALRSRAVHGRFRTLLSPCRSERVLPKKYSGFIHLDSIHAIPIVRLSRLTGWF